MALEAFRTPWSDIKRQYRQSLEVPFPRVVVDIILAHVAASHQDFYGDVRETHLMSGSRDVRGFLVFGTDRDTTCIALIYDRKVELRRPFSWIPNEVVWIPETLGRIRNWQRGEDHCELQLAYGVPIRARINVRSNQFLVCNRNAGKPFRWVDFERFVLLERTDTLLSWTSPEVVQLPKPVGMSHETLVRGQNDSTWWSLSNHIFRSWDLFVKTTKDVKALIVLPDSIVVRTSDWRVEIYDKDTSRTLVSLDRVVRVLKSGDSCLIFQFHSRRVFSWSAGNLTTLFDLHEPFRFERFGFASCGEGFLWGLERKRGSKTRVWKHLGSGQIWNYCFAKAPRDVQVLLQDLFVYQNYAGDLYVLS